MTGDVPLSTVPPAAFGRFRVLHQIGAGSLGPVFRAEDPASQTSVVIKVLRLYLTPERARIVTDELAALQDRVPAHPGIAPVVKAGIREIEPFVVSTFTPGDGLDVTLRQSGPAPIVEALPRLVQVAAGLDFCAEASIWHGGLHPRDLLLSPDETAVVGVGIAPILERVGVKLPVRRPYTAPEVVDGGPTTPAADQFALAAIAFEWLYGRRITGPAEQRENVPALAGVDRVAMADAFTSALALNPEDRFESCSAFVAALANAVEKAEAAPRPTAISSRRRPRPAPMASIVPSLPGGSSASAAARDELDDEEERVSHAPATVLSIDDLRLGESASEGAPYRLQAASPKPARAPWITIAAVAIGGAIVLGGGVGYWFAVKTVSGQAPDEPPHAAASAAGEPVAAPAAPPAVGDAAAASNANAGAGQSVPAPVPPDVSEAPPPVDGGGVRTEQAGRVLVRSTPAGADVIVNGERRGATPLALRDLPFGRYAISVSRAGYTSEQHQVILTAARPSQSLEISLVGGPGVSGGSITSSTIAAPGATIGGLMIESRPVGATVFIDGRVMGITPLMMDRLSPGAHAVRLERTGYHTWTTTVNVVAGELTRLAASLAGGY